MEKRTTVVIHEVGAGAKVVKKPDDPFALVEDFSSPENSWSGKLFQKLSQKVYTKYHNLFLFLALYPKKFTARITTFSETIYTFDFLSSIIDSLFSFSDMLGDIWLTHFSQPRRKEFIILSTFLQVILFPWLRLHCCNHWSFTKNLNSTFFHKFLL